MKGNRESWQAGFNETGSLKPDRRTDEIVSSGIWITPLSSNYLSHPFIRLFPGESSLLQSHVDGQKRAWEEGQISFLTSWLLSVFFAFGMIWLEKRPLTRAESAMTRGHPVLIEAARLFVALFLEKEIFEGCLSSVRQLPSSRHLSES